MSNFNKTNIITPNNTNHNYMDYLHKCKTEDVHEIRSTIYLPRINKPPEEVPIVYTSTEPLCFNIFMVHLDRIENQCNKLISKTHCSDK